MGCGSSKEAEEQLLRLEERIASIEENNLHESERLHEAIKALELQIAASTSARLVEAAGKAGERKIWLKFLADDGKPYYYCPDTAETVWDVPPGDEVREAPHMRPSSKAKVAAATIPKNLKVADEEMAPVLAHCIPWLREHGLDCPGIFRIPASIVDVTRLSKRYSSSKKVKDTALNSNPILAAGLIKHHFRTRADAIIPAPLCECLYVSSRAGDDKVEGLRGALAVLPPGRRRILGDLFGMLHAASLVQENQMDSRNLSMCLSPSLFPDFPSGRAISIGIALIEHAEEVFGEGGGASTATRGTSQANNGQSTFSNPHYGADPGELLRERGESGDEEFEEMVLHDDVQLQAL